VDEGLLNRMRLRTRSQSFKRRDLRSGDTGNRRDAGPDRLTFNDDRTTTALAQAAAKLRAAKCQIVAEYVQQRRRRIHVQRVGTAVDLQSDHAPLHSPPKYSCS